MRVILAVGAAAHYVRGHVALHSTTVSPSLSLLLDLLCCVCVREWDERGAVHAAMSETAAERAGEATHEKGMIDNMKTRTSGLAWRGERGERREDRG